jgi:hydroxymethylpyrimidine/phosphomethylpyrimidine kinase
VLVDAVVVAGDDSGADVGLFADLGVAQICEVVGLRALAQPDLLGLNKVAHMGVFADLAARP